MPYAPTDWVDGVTPVNAANLDKIEAGVAAAEEKALKAQVNGYASLDGTGKVPLAQLPPIPDAGMEYYEQAAVPTEPVGAGAVWVDTDELPYAWASGIPLVSVLPATPQNGQEVYYLADATNGIIWHLRYRVDSPSAYKWELVGGPELTASNNALFTTTNQTYGDWGGVPEPKLTVPLAGDYLARFGCTMECNAGTQRTFATLAIGGSALDANCVSTAQANQAGSSQGASAARDLGLPGLAASTVLKMMYRNALAAVSTYEKRWLAVRPVRVG